MKHRFVLMIGLLAVPDHAAGARRQSGRKLARPPGPIAPFQRIHRSRPVDGAGGVGATLSALRRGDAGAGKAFTTITAQAPPWCWAWRWIFRASARPSAMKWRGSRRTI